MRIGFEESARRSSIFDNQTNDRRGRVRRNAGRRERREPADREFISIEEEEEEEEEKGGRSLAKRR